MSSEVKSHYTFKLNQYFQLDINYEVKMLGHGHPSRSSKGNFEVKLGYIVKLNQMFYMDINYVVIVLLY